MDTKNFSNFGWRFFHGFLLGFKSGVGIYFSVGSVLGFSSLFYGFGIGKKWKFGAWAFDLIRYASPHHLFMVLSLLFLASWVRRLSKCCDAVEDLAVRFGKASGDARRAVCFDGVVCAVCGSKVSSWKTNLEPIVEGVSLEKLQRKNCPTPPVVQELGEAEEREDNEKVGDFDRGEEVDAMVLKKRLEEETKLKEAALKELEMERRAAASAADEAMAKIAYLQNEKALVEREARQFYEMAKQKQMYDRQVIESLQWMISRFGASPGEAESPFDRMSDVSEDEKKCGSPAFL